MNEVMDFLAQNYIYVAAGSLAVIVILILIIVLGNKRRKKKENEGIANIGEIKTGSIDDVANNINAGNANVVAPQEIGEVTQAVPVVNADAPEEAVSPFVNEMPVQEEVPTANATVVEPIPESTGPIQGEVKPKEEVPVAEVVAEPIPELEPTPVEVPKEEESPIQAEIGIPVIEPTEIPVEEKAAEVVPEVQKEEPKEEASVVEPVVEPTPAPVKEELEVFGLDDDEPVEKEGTAVAGFSSVNVEK